ncbi:hypothetical protein QYE76_045615 [Lolium multiflorum]|uniref:Uncharacterized protein n=1 Tax=Lolium multiflorum TaxID=4521 RepID=A0AAD8WXM9_LOLMU|nr:hypothetical protein QYE76_045615 [Lolium multiflorum]
MAGRGGCRARGRGRGRGRGRSAHSPSPATPSSSSSEMDVEGPVKFEFVLVLKGDPRGIQRLPDSYAAYVAGDDRPGTLHLREAAYEEGASIARGGEEQLDQKMDVKLDMELDMKTFHECAREEREACARGEAEDQAGARSGPAVRRTIGPRGPSGRVHPVSTGRGACAIRALSSKPKSFVRSPPGARPGLNGTGQSQTVDRGAGRLKSVSTGSIRENKDSADIITWREFEALRNEMRREFRAQDDELKGTVQEISQKIDATNETVTTMQDQMTDIQRTLRTLQMSIENLTNRQQQQHEDDDEVPGRGDRPRGWAPLGRNGRGHDEEDGFGKPKFSIPKFEGGADVEEYLTWELKIEKLWNLHPNYTEDRKIKLASSEFVGYALRWRDALIRHFKRNFPNRKVMIINEYNEYETGDDVDPNAPEDDDYDTDGEDAYPSDARTIVVSQRALNVLPSASTQRCNLFQTKALVGPDKACKWLSDNGGMKVNHMVRVEFEIGPYKDCIDFDVVPMTEFGDVFPEEVPAGLPPLRDRATPYHRWIVDVIYDAPDKMYLHIVSEKFARHHSLEAGFILLFSYFGGRDMSVKVFDETRYRWDYHDDITDREDD